MKLLISPSYGAGWSTWNCPEMAMDKDLIELFEKGCTCEEMERACLKKKYGGRFGYNYVTTPYMGGFSELKVVEVPKGALFRINEYDGSESVEVFDPDNWLVAEK